MLPEEIAPPRLAFLGVRACELHAIAIQDKVFAGGAFADPSYQARRGNIFIVAVNCGQAGNTCFCVSMKTGPKATAGFDLALTEILEGDRHYFVVESGSAAGAEVLAELPEKPAAERGDFRGGGGDGARGLANGPDARDRRDQANCSTAISSIRVGTKWRRVASLARIARSFARPAFVPTSRTSPT